MRGSDQFERNRPLERDISRAINDPHATFTRDSVDAMACEARTELEPGDLTRSDGRKSRAEP